MARSRSLPAPLQVAVDFCQAIYDRYVEPPLMRFSKRERRMILGGVGSGLAILLVALVMYSLGGSDAPAQALNVEREWFYDLSTGELFVQPRGTIPPVAATSGAMVDGEPTGVRAFVYAPAAQPDQTIVGYLVTTTPGYRAAMQLPDAQRGEALAKLRADNAKLAGRPKAAPRPAQRPHYPEGELVALPGKPVQWVPMLSEEGEAILRAPRKEHAQITERFP